jgi:hypothetical protein
MPSNTYLMQTRWRLAAPREEVYRILEDSPDFVRWWPAVWLKAEVLEPGDSDGIGKRVRFLTKGWLPYKLRWTALSTEKVSPERLRIEASGDFNGEGCWTLAESSGETTADYRWEIEAEKPLLKYLSFLFRPIFVANHNWAMRSGEESLKQELLRRHAKQREVQS